MASAIIVAAGSSSRMGSDKILLSLCGAPVLAHTLAAFEQCEQIGEIIVVTKREMLPAVRALAAKYSIHKLSAVVEGGATRSQSVRQGILVSDARFPLLCIHDGARPLVTQRVIVQALACAQQIGCATAVVPLKDTVKRAHNGLVIETPDRAALFSVQTPQVFRRSIYLDCCERAGEFCYSDDCMLAEQYGYPVALSEGDYENIKLTTPEDILIAKAFLTRRMSDENRAGI